MYSRPNFRLVLQHTESSPWKIDVPCEKRSVDASTTKTLIRKKWEPTGRQDRLYPSLFRSCPRTESRFMFRQDKMNIDRLLSHPFGSKRRCRRQTVGLAVTAVSYTYCRTLRLRARPGLPRSSSWILAAPLTLPAHSFSSEHPLLLVRLAWSGK